MIRLITLTFVSSFLVSICTAQEPIPALPFCNDDKECSTGCNCVPQIQNFCAISNVLNNTLSSCIRCSVSEGCASNDLCIIDPPGGDSGYCASCALPAAFRASATCKSSLLAAPPVIPLTSPSIAPSPSTPTSADPSVFPTSKPSVTPSSGLKPPSPSSISVPSFFPASEPIISPELEFDDEVIPSSEPNFLATSEPVDEPIDEPVCVDSKWIEEHGLGDGIYKKYGKTRVLCVASDFPCGTPGHILRACDANGCSLKTYDEVCASTTDCLETVKPVARLRHNFDWVIVQSTECTKFGKLYLTSVSRPVGAGPYAPSRVLAQIADSLNTYGLGVICDSFVSTTSYIMQVLQYFRNSIPESLQK